MAASVIGRAYSPVPLENRDEAAAVSIPFAYLYKKAPVREAITSFLDNHSVHDLCAAELANEILRHSLPKIRATHRFHILMGVYRHRLLRLLMAVAALCSFIGFSQLIRVVYLNDCIFPVVAVPELPTCTARATMLLHTIRVSSGAGVLRANADGPAVGNDQPSNGNRRWKILKGAGSWYNIVSEDAAGSKFLGATYHKDFLEASSGHWNVLLSKTDEGTGRQRWAIVNKTGSIVEILLDDHNNPGKLYLTRSFSRSHSRSDTFQSVSLSSTPNIHSDWIITNWHHEDEEMPIQCLGSDWMQFVAGFAAIAFSTATLRVGKAASTVLKHTARTPKDHTHMLLSPALSWMVLVCNLAFGRFPWSTHLSLALIPVVAFLMIRGSIQFFWGPRRILVFGVPLGIAFLALAAAAGLKNIGVVLLQVMVAFGLGAWAELLDDHWRLAGGAQHKYILSVVILVSTYPMAVVGVMQLSEPLSRSYPAAVMFQDGGVIVIAMYSLVVGFRKDTGLSVLTKAIAKGRTIAYPKICSSSQDLLTWYFLLLLTGLMHWLISWSCFLYLMPLDFHDDTLLRVLWWFLYVAVIASCSFSSSGLWGVHYQNFGPVGSRSSYNRLNDQMKLFRQWSSLNLVLAAFYVVVPGSLCHSEHAEFRGSFSAGVLALAVLTMICILLGAFYYSIEQVRKEVLKFVRQDDAVASPPLSRQASTVAQGGGHG